MKKKNNFKVKFQAIRSAFFAKKKHWVDNPEGLSQNKLKEEDIFFIVSSSFLNLSFISSSSSSNVKSWRSGHLFSHFFYSFLLPVITFNSLTI